MDGAFRNLKNEYHKDGMIQLVVWRNETLAIASVHAKDNDRLIGFEVWRIQSAGEREIGGVTIDAGEFPPSAATWGVKGWSVADYPAAKAKVDEIMQSDAETEANKC